MSQDLSANNGPIKDRFAPFNKFENELLNEIAICSESDKKERLTWKLATFYIETARPDKAVTLLQWILETTRNNESKKDSLQALRFLAGDKEGTIPVSYENLDLPEVLWQMGNVYLGKGNQQSGILCLLRMLDISSDRERRAESFLLLGAECEKVDDHNAAVRLYQRGIECGPKESGTRYFLHNNLGYCLNQLERHAEAEEYCRDAIEIEPMRHNGYKNLGVALQGQGTYPEAAACFVRAAIMFSPDLRSVGHLEELLVHHWENVEREIPDIAEHFAAAVEARNRLIQ